MMMRYYGRLLNLVLLIVDVAQSLSAQTRHPFRVYYDSSNHLHRDIQYHPEQPERISACVSALKEAFLLRQESSSSSPAIEIIDIAPESSESESNLLLTDAELKHARDILLQTHQPELVTQLEERCRKSKQQRLNDERATTLGHMGYIDNDTYVTTESFDVCLRATAAWIRAVDYARAGKASAFALTRPPGHHATYKLQNGFCLYNFAAAAAIHCCRLRNNDNDDDTTTSSKAPTRVSILDWDVHYGQGVADIVRRRNKRNNKNNIRYVSIHQTPAFPYEGERTGITDDHTVMTLPMPPDTTWTCGYAGLFEKALEFCCNQQDWMPDVIIVCAGYDALSSDELAGTSLNAADYGRMTRRLCEHVASVCSNNNNSRRPAIMFGLEGGYSLANSGPSGNLPDAVVETIKAMMEQEYL